MGERRSLGLTPAKYWIVSVAGSLGSRLCPFASTCENAQAPLCLVSVCPKLNAKAGFYRYVDDQSGAAVLLLGC